MRVFFSGGADSFQLFTVNQNPNDGSIYFCAPAFDEIDWLVPALDASRQPTLLSYQAGGDGKLSLHGSGVAHVRPYASRRPNEFAIRGSMLRETSGNALGVRHLLTLFPSEPRHKPNSPAMARKSDGVMTTTRWHPYVMVFWAVPATRSLTVIVNATFNDDDLEEVPPNGGWGAFGLELHAIVWFAYRTKHMGLWPRNSQACYNDGRGAALKLAPVLASVGLNSASLVIHFPMDVSR
jgi:hypothetical protein